MRVDYGNHADTAFQPRAAIRDIAPRRADGRLSNTNSRRTLMINTRSLIGSALAAAATLGAAAAFAGPAAQPEYSFEKCYGVVKAGQNDCQTATHSWKARGRQHRAEGLIPERMESGEDR
jgi:uncharacterized membrane protein